MKQNYFLKAAGVVAVLVLMSNQATAQKSTGDFAKIATAVKVVDNKGTIKYLQTGNGISQITNTTNDVTTTTWQLGGTLTDDTFIDATGKAFGLKGLVLNTTGSASVDGTAAGYTLLVSDVSGKVERILASSLIQSGSIDDELTATKTAIYTIAGTSGLPTVADRISVFRNGIKLRKTDWALTSGTVTITPTTDLPLYQGDLINVQWVN